MSTTTRRQFLLAEKATVSALAERLERGQFVERFSLKSRLRAIEAELEQLPETPAPARAAVLFSGAPVVGQESIEASFAANALASFRTLVKKVAESRPRGTRRGDFALHVTGLAHGSFGFEVAHVAASQTAQRHAAAALEETSAVLRTLTGDEDALAQFMAEAEPKVLKSLSGFLKVLSSSNATLRIVGSGSEVSVTDGHAFRALGWLEGTEPQVEEKTVPGIFIGMMTTSRQFEFRDESDTVLGGYLGGLVSDADIERFFLKSCVARIKTTKVKRPGYAVKVSHVLESLHPPARGPLLPGPTDS